MTDFDIESPAINETTILPIPKIRTEVVGFEAEKNAIDTLNKLSASMADPVEFFDNFNSLEPGVQFYVARTIGRRINQPDESYAVDKDLYRIYFPNNLHPDDKYFEKFDRVKNGLIINGNNLIAQPRELPTLPAGYTPGMIEEKILGTPAQEPGDKAKLKEVSNFILVSLLYPVYKNYHKNNADFEASLQTLKDRKGFVSPPGDPPVKMILDQNPYNWSEKNWFRRVR